MGEGRAFGWSCGLLPRRLFVITTCSAFVVICVAQLSQWLLAIPSIANYIHGVVAEAPPHEDCTGASCYEVFTCFGMKDASRHIREPIVSLLGIVMLPLGIFGVWTERVGYTKLLTGYLVASCTLHAGLLIGDNVYYFTCQAYSSNLVWQTLLQWPHIIAPVRAVDRETLAKMNSYPIPDVERFVDGERTLLWCLGIASVWVIVLAFVASEAYTLSRLFEYGTLGLGVHYGIEWDHIAKTDANTCLYSKFVDDARIPKLESGTSVESPGFRVPLYGSTRNSACP